MKNHHLEYIKVSNDNLILATKTQMKIFPLESAYKEFLDCINDGVEYNNYYIVYDGSKIIGITGLYNNDAVKNSDSLFMGWFGVLPEVRNLGYGLQILCDTFEMAKKFDISYFRVFTSTKENKNVLPLYDKFFDFKEEYTNQMDETFNNSCVIYTKIIKKTSNEKWNNRFLNIKEMIEKESIGNSLILDK